MPNCPNCGASNASEDTFCRYCGAELSAGSPPPQQAYSQQPYQQPDTPATADCRYCGATNPPTSAHCVSCGNALGQSQQPAYQQPSYPPPGASPPPYQQPAYAPPAAPRRTFRWWMLFTWPFICLGMLFRCNANSRRRYSSCSSSSGCDCGDCADCACDGCDCN